ncbi:hypothetical protein J2S53_001340 [Actinopolyspora lacussalsi]|nr:hypothetical protein [Actinopolyspora lacussalsi]
MRDERATTTASEAVAEPTGSPLTSTGQYALTETSAEPGTTWRAGCAWPQADAFPTSWEVPRNGVDGARPRLLPGAPSAPDF